MKNSKFKEIIIALLLCLAIMLVLALVLYNYVPSTKTLPEKVAYTTPQKVRDELVAASDLDEDQIILTYEVDGHDMANYENINSYNPGNANPFAVFEKDDGGNIIGTSTAGTSSGGSGTTASGENSNAGNSGSVNAGSGNVNAGNSEGATSGAQSGSSSAGTVGGTSGTDTTIGGSQFYHDKGGK